MKDFMQAEGLPVPEYKTEGMFTVILKRPGKSVEKMSEKMSEKILSLIQGNTSITIEELASKTGKKSRTIERYLHRLKIARLIIRFVLIKVGTGK